MHTRYLLFIVLTVLPVCTARAAINVRAESKGFSADNRTDSFGYVDVFIETTGTNPPIAGFQVVLNRGIAGAGKLNFVPPFAKPTDHISDPGGPNQLPRTQLIAENFLPNFGGTDAQARA